MKYVPCDVRKANSYPPQDCESLEAFMLGDRVRLGKNISQKEYAGREGMVARRIKCHNFVRVGLDGGTEVYDAFPENLERISHAREDY